MNVVRSAASLFVKPSVFQLFRSVGIERRPTAVNREGSLHPILLIFACKIERFRPRNALKSTQMKRRPLRWKREDQ